MSPILRDQRLLPRAEIDAIDVEHARVAPVVAHQDVLRIVEQDVEDAGAHFFARREIGDLAALDIDRHHVEVLVAAEILVVQDGVAALPVVEVDVARGFPGELARFAHQTAALQRLHEHVQPAAAVGRDDRLHEPERAAVFAQAEVGAFRIAEEVLDRERRWQILRTCHAEHGGGRDSDGKQQGAGQALQARPGRASHGSLLWNWEAASVRC